ncbi:MAG: alpha/beta hydrolase [Planctomycetes bacterium]|nr:alpha/beta hydrolase [Planctomycetota bacterium]MBL7037250.1 alpha/beta hydrolase [Pirellulaceae bacterium]
MRSVIQKVCTALFIVGLLLGRGPWYQEVAAAQENVDPQPAAPAGKADWAKKFLKQDPLEEKIPTYEDLLDALQDPDQRDRAISRHFPRAEDLTREQQEELLRLALGNESPVVQRQAAAEMKRLGMLEKVVQDILLDLLRDEDPEIRRAAVVALEKVELEEHSDEYLDAVVDTLAAEDPLARGAAERQLADLGAEAVPVLLEALRSDDPQARVNAAIMLSQIVGSKKAVVGQLPLAAVAEPPPTKARDTTELGGTGERPRGRKVRHVDEAQPETVRVYFGTNRELVSESAPLWRKFVVLPGVIVFLCVWFCFIRWREKRSAKRRNVEWSKRFSFGFLLVAVVLVVWGIVELNSAVRETYAQHAGAEFGPRRDPQGSIRYGHCDVTLPPTHEIGEVERPLLGPEDEKEHVVLKRTTLLDDKAFYNEIRKELSSREVGAHDCFVFVHGFNVTFEKAAQRTAQIHYDLKFPGVPLFYSWPSRGSLRHYPADRNEIGYSKEHIKRFLVDVAENIDAGRIHVIAHSMGGDAVSRAIAEIEGDDRLFDQIILAAPDIDADVFRDHIVPRLALKGRRTTLYCSRCDLALHMSYAFNDYPRAGDSSRRIVVADDMDTVDASEIPTDLLGHSYYGDGMRLLEDIKLLFQANTPPPDRDLQSQNAAEGLAYWIFGES